MSRLTVDATDTCRESSFRRLLSSGVIFIFLVGLIVFRDSSLFTEPRFWAEEATIYFRTAYTSPVFHTLIAPHQGFYSLWANLASILATIPPLEEAPAVTTGMALLVLLVIIGAILTSESTFLDSTLKKAIASLLVVVVGATGEIWLTTINSQHYFPLLVFIILIDRKDNPVKRHLWYSVVTIAGLSSPAANFLAPLFLISYLQRRDRADLGLFFVLLATSAVQFVAVIESASILNDPVYSDPLGKRFSMQFNPLLLIYYIVFYSTAYPLFGDSLKHSWLSAAAAMALVVSLFLARRRLTEYLQFPLAVCLLTTLSVVSSLNMRGGPRYAYSAAVIVALQLLAQAGDTKLTPGARLTAGVLLFASISYWCLEFWPGFNRYHYQNWPVWSSEVKAWRADPNRELHAWPIWEDQTAAGQFWKLRLPPTK